MTQPSEVVYQDGYAFKILNDNITIYSEATPFGYNTVAELDSKMTYLGSELVNLTTAIFAWEYIHGRLLTKEELHQVLTDHSLV